MTDFAATRRLFHLPDLLVRAAFSAGEATGGSSRRLDSLYGWRAD